jgi:putative hemolysin
VTGIIILEVVVIFILVIINGLLAMSELSIISSRKARLRTLAEAGDTKARTALELSESPDRMLSTVQIGITMMGILSGAFGGAELAEILGGALVNFGISEGAANTVSFAFVVLSITYLSLVIGELVPKRIALLDPEAAARRLAGPIKLLSKVASPFVTVLSGSTSLVLKLLGVNKIKESTVSEEEVQMLIDEGTKSGVFEEHERQMVGSIFKMSDLSVKDLMTPRHEIDWLNLEDPTDTIIECVRESPHTMFPVGEGSLDKTIGMVKAKDLLHQMISTSTIDLQSILRQPVMIPETATAFEGLELLRSSRSPLALIVDEYGGIEGIVTHTDLLSTIAGDMDEATDSPMFTKRSDGSYLLDGMLPIEEFRELVAHGDPDPSNGGYNTLAGFVLSNFGRLPKAGDSFEWNGYTIEVLDLDGNRIDKLLLTTSRPASE